MGPASGSWYAVTDMNVVGTQILLQTFTVPADSAGITVAYDLFVQVYGSMVNNFGGSLDFNLFPNQHARVDILTAGADPMDVGVGVVATLYGPAVDGNPVLPYQHYEFDLTGMLVPGETYQIRFAEVVNNWYQEMGVDNVSILATSDSSATVTITVTGVNDAPVANDDGYPTDEDTPIDIAVPGVLGNDTDLDSGATLTIDDYDVTGTLGAVSLNDDGSFSYDPTVGFDGLDDGETDFDSFTYTVTDGLATDTATVTFTVDGRNDAPVAVADADLAVKNAPRVVAAAGVLSNDTDVDVEALSVYSVNGDTGNVGVQITLASGALLTVNANGSFTYDPNHVFDFLGDTEEAIDTFAYIAWDGDAESNEVTVTITISGQNDPPVANDDLFTLTEDETLGGNVMADNGNGEDYDINTSDVLTVDSINGSPALVGTEFALASGALLRVNADGSLSYDPRAAHDKLDDTEQAIDSFTYTITDGIETVAATVTITVNGVNDAPVATDDVGTTDENTPLVVAAPGVLGNDTDVDIETLTVSVVDDTGVIGQVSWNADGSGTYSPNGQFEYLDDGESAIETFTYTVSDGTATDTATVTVTVTGVNDVPVVAGESYIITEDEILSFAAPGLLANDSDADSDDTMVVYTVNGSQLDVGVPLTLGSGASLQVNPDGSFTYDPTVAFAGMNPFEVASDGFTYTVSDGTAESALVAVDITINGLNDLPVAEDDPLYATDEDTPLSVAADGVLGNDYDPDTNDDITLLTVNGSYMDGGSEITLASGALVTQNYDGSLSYDPNGQFESLPEGGSTTDSYDYTITDLNLIAGMQVLIIRDSWLGPQCGDDLQADLEAAGFTVTVSPTTMVGYTGANPAPAGFDAVILVNDSITQLVEMPVAGQAALVAYVQNGGAFLTGAQATYAQSISHLALMNDLIPMVFNPAAPDVTATYQKIPTYARHAILRNVPDPFVVTHVSLVGTLRDYGVDPAQNLLTVTDLGGNEYPGVVARQFQAGRVVQFNHSENVPGGGTMPLCDVNLRKLYIDGVKWAAAEQLTTDTASVTITVNGVNDTPTDIGLTNASVEENSAIGTPVGNLSTVDPDTGDTFTYSILTGGVPFQVNGDRLEVGGAINFEATPSFDITIRTTDLNGAWYDEVFTIDIIDVNEAPVVDDQLFAIDENSPDGSVVGTVIASDVDAGDSLTYAITGGNTGNGFDIDPDRRADRERHGGARLRNEPGLQPDRPGHRHGCAYRYRDRDREPEQRERGPGRRRPGLRHRREQPERHGGWGGASLRRRRARDPDLRHHRRKHR